MRMTPPSAQNCLVARRPSTRRLNSAGGSAASTPNLAANRHRFLGIFRCRCSLGKFRRARTHCKLPRRLPYVQRPPARWSDSDNGPVARFRILRRAVGGFADFADGAARSKNSDSLFAAACSENLERLTPRKIFAHGASSSDLALVCCMRLATSWLLPNGWLAAPVRRRFHCTAHIFCRTPLVDLHIFQSLAARREKPTLCTVQPGC